MSYACRMICANYFHKVEYHRQITINLQGMKKELRAKACHEHFWFTLSTCTFRSSEGEPPHSPLLGAYCILKGKIQKNHTKISKFVESGFLALLQVSLRT